jgi:hypothetical protein
VEIQASGDINLLSTSPIDQVFVNATVEVLNGGGGAPLPQVRMPSPNGTLQSSTDPYTQQQEQLENDIKKVVNFCDSNFIVNALCGALFGKVGGLFGLQAAAYGSYTATEIEAGMMAIGSTLPAIDKEKNEFRQADQVDEYVNSYDPNDKVGSHGVGVEQYISGATPLRYTVFFSNKETATAPAQQVVISDQLDITKDDLKSLSIGPVAFGSQLVSPPPFQTDFSTTVDLRPATNLLVAIRANLNSSNGLLTWNLQSLDPSTGLPPPDPTAGFLPPGGEGSVFFTVMPKQSLPTNTQITNQANIVFDVNAAIATPTWLNTLDNSSPTSSVQPLPPAEPTGAFTLSWSGTDVGAGVQDYTIYVSDNGGPFAPFLTNTTGTSATFTGQPGHTYGFYSIARDLVGNLEPSKTSTEATTTVALATPTVSFTGAPATAAYESNFTVSATTNASTTAVITASGACSIVGNIVTMTSGTGACGLTASWAADGNYLAATATQSTAAVEIAPTVAFTGAPASAAYNTSFAVAATTNASTTAVITASGACSIAGNTVTMTTGTGACNLTATWATDSNYLAATATQATTAVTVAPTVTFTGAPASAPYNTSFAVTATTNASTTAVITASAACSIAGNTVTMTSGTGSCLLSATWTADSNYNAATASQSTAAAKIAPTVTFTGAPASATYNTSFAVMATTNASTTAAITASGACSIAGNAVTMTSGTGTCSLSASWAADNNYNAATAGQSTAAAKAGSATTITANAPNPSTVGQAVAVSFKVAGNGSPTGNVSVTASTGESCSGALTVGAGSCLLTFNSAGSRALTAAYAGDGNFNGSMSVGVAQTVSAASSLTISPSSVNFGNVYLGLPAFQTVTVKNTGSASININRVATSKSGNDSDDFKAFSLCPSNLKAGKSCEIVVTFTADGDDYSPSGTLVITDSAAGSPQSVPLSGTVINPKASLSSDRLDFGKQKVGTTSAPQTVTLTSSGRTSLSLSSLNIGGDFSFAMGTTCTSGESLGAGTSCSINVNFTPTAKGKRLGSVTIKDNTLLKEQIIVLSGTGN